MRRPTPLTATGPARGPGPGSRGGAPGLWRPGQGTHSAGRGGRHRLPRGRGDVTTRGAITLETLRTPGLSVERSLELSGQWFSELCLWLQSPIGELGNIGWPMVLIPEIIDSRYRLGDTALQVYQRVEWSGTVPQREFTAS